MRTAVMYVHGLWMIGMEGALLRRRLAETLDAETPFFHYRSVAAGISTNAQLLADGLRRIKADTVHLVGHSLGGLLILKLFEEGAATFLPPGRVVLLGSPAGGSHAAQQLARWRVGRALLGHSVRETLLTRTERLWNEPRDLGIVAGTMNVGLGRLVNTLTAPSDGTVYVDETRIAGMKEHLLVRVSHTGLPFSRNVARQSAAFLQQGHFPG